jgi:hypothetical protein
MNDQTMCEADSGSATDCQPICRDAATYRLSYRTGLGTRLSVLLCARHVTRETNRLYPWRPTDIVPLPGVTPTPGESARHARYVTGRVHVTA